MRHRGEKNITEDIHYESLSTETDGEAEDSGASDERADIDAEHRKNDQFLQALTRSPHPNSRSIDTI